MGDKIGSHIEKQKRITIQIRANEASLSLLMLISLNLHVLYGCRTFSPSYAYNTIGNMIHARRNDMKGVDGSPAKTTHSL